MMVCWGIFFANVFSIDDSTIRLGFNYVRGIGEAASERLLGAGQGRAFTDLYDICQRSDLSQFQLENLIQAGEIE